MLLGGSAYVAGAGPGAAHVPLMRARYAAWVLADTRCALHRAPDWSCIMDDCLARKLLFM